MPPSHGRLSDDPRWHLRALPPTPRKEVSEPQRLRQRSKDFIDRTRLTLSLKRALHEIEMRVRELESHLFQPRGSRQYYIRKAPGRLVHEQIDGDDQLCL